MGAQILFGAPYMDIVFLNGEALQLHFFTFGEAHWNIVPNLAKQNKIFFI